MLATVLAAISYDPIQRIGIGPVGVSPHGLGTAGGFLFGAMLMSRAAERRGIARADAQNAVTWGAVGALLGARGFYVLAHLSDFSSIADMLAVWRGGLTMFGGFAGGILAGLIYARRHDIPIGPAMDAAAPGFVSGVAIGRIGDLLIADHLGNPTNFFLGYRIPRTAELAPGYGPPAYVPGAVVHQTALYDLLGVGVLALVVWFVSTRRTRSGALFCTFAVWYGLQRFAIDFTRNREMIESSFFGLSGSQWAGLAFAAAGAVWLVRLYRAAAPREDVAVTAAAAEEAEIAAAVTADARTAVDTPEPVEVPAPIEVPEPVEALQAEAAAAQDATTVDAEPEPAVEESALPVVEEGIALLEEVAAEIAADDFEERTLAAEHEPAADELEERTRVDPETSEPTPSGQPEVTPDASGESAGER